jgi:hypothetical protein
MHKDIWKERRGYYDDETTGLPDYALNTLGLELVPKKVVTSLSWRVAHNDVVDCLDRLGRSAAC